MIRDTAEDVDDRVLEDAILPHHEQIYDERSRVCGIMNVNRWTRDVAIKFPTAQPDGLSNVGAEDPGGHRADTDEGSAASGAEP